MKRVVTLLFGFALLAMAQWKQDPLVGRWQMISQTVGTSKTPPLPIAITITQKGPELTFTYLAGREEKVNMKFTVREDGPEAVITNVSGARMGTAKLAKVGSKYVLTLQSPGRPAEPGTLTLSEADTILTVESNPKLPDTGPTRVVQVFAKN